jgi:O-antigen ligase
VASRHPGAEHIRALIVILVFAAAVFGFARKPTRQLIGNVDFNRRRNLWFAVTLVAFLSHNFWIYATATSLLLLFATKREDNPVALFFMLLFAVPAAYVDIPGFGVINYLFSLSHQRILTLAVFVPTFLAIVRDQSSPAFGRTMPDKFIGLYMLLVILLYLRETSITDTLRQAFYQFVDVFLPFYVVSRSLKSCQSFQQALLTFVLAIMLMALIGIFESVRHWLLYSSLTKALGLESGMTSYLMRAGSLRAIASSGQPIALGYVMAVAIGLYLFLQQSISSRLVRRLGLALLLAGLAVSLSRGPWVGALALTTVFIATGRHALKRLMLLGLVAVMSLSLLSILPGGERILNLVPFIGQTEKANIDYREELLKNSLIVIERNPWFGSVDYIDQPEMDAMRQGQGIIDIVNTYVRVALETGLIGLALFVGFFASVLLGVYRAMKSIKDKDATEHLLGRALFATLTGALVIIFTVSSITIVPVVYWSLAGLGVAYVQLVKTG